jgi:aryl carrier-like protein
VAKKPPAPTISQLRRFLQHKLPDYMVPNAFVILDALPLTPNGKVDRPALPAPEVARPELEGSFVAPRTPIEELLALIWAGVLGLEQVGIHDNFFELGGNSIQAMILINKLQEKIKQILHVVAIFDAPTVAKFADYLNREYPHAMAEWLGYQVSPGIRNNKKINVSKIAQMQLLLKQQYLCYQSSAQTPDSTNKNQPAIFILSPPRSGSTLLRVILGGHPQLFAPPEMYLLPYKTLRERKAILSGRKNYQLEGVIRTVMQIQGCNAEEAQHLLQDLEEKQLTVKQFYGLLQQWIAGKILVDKTPAYTYNLEILKRAEVCFENPLYIHLLRHPYGTIRSIEESRIDLLIEGETSLTTREKAELLWLLSHQNILEFLKHIPESRQYQLKFENLVKFPQNTVAGICQFLGVDFYAEMLQPHKNKKQRMTDGLHSVSRMIGDPKFHTHKEIDARSADRWKQDYTVDFLLEETWQIAESLGYERIFSMKDDREQEEF